MPPAPVMRSCGRAFTTTSACATSEDEPNATANETPNQMRGGRAERSAASEPRWANEFHASMCRHTGRDRGRRYRRNGASNAISPARMPTIRSAKRRASSGWCSTQTMAKPLVRELSQQRQHVDRRIRIEAGDRLIGQQDARTLRERASDRDALRLAAGQACRRAAALYRPSPRCTAVRAQTKAPSSAGIPALRQTNYAGQAFQSPHLPAHCAGARGLLVAKRKQPCSAHDAAPHRTSAKNPRRRCESFRSSG